MARMTWLLSVAVLSVAPVRAAEKDAQPTSPPPQRLTDPASGMEFVFVKGGCFQMGNGFGPDGGSPDPAEAAAELPVHEVCVGDFYIGKFEATQGQWKRVMGRPIKIEGGCDGKSVCSGDDCPVGNVSWDQIQDFLKRLNAGEAIPRYRLPTDAEWEYAARSGGKSERYAGGNDADSVSWGAAPAGGAAHPVGRLQPNGLGLYDMSGNQYEATSDWYAGDYYATSPRDNPTGPATGELHTKRGGCQSGGTINSRVARRVGWMGEPCDNDGFRVVRVP